MQEQAVLCQLRSEKRLMRPLVAILENINFAEFRPPGLGNIKMMIHKDFFARPVIQGYKASKADGRLLGLKEDSFIMKIKIIGTAFFDHMGRRGIERKAFDLFPGNI